MTIDLVEYGGFWAKAADRAFEDAIASDWGYASTPYKVWGYLQDKNHLYNFTNFGDPYIAEQYTILGTLVDSDEINKILRELDMHLKEEAYFMTFPVPVEYVFWQPWIKGYNGEYYSWGARRLHAWIDQDLKTEMGH
jgi:ABC-type transport system substrate-binding protein